MMMRIMDQVTILAAREQQAMELIAAFPVNLPSLSTAVALDRLMIVIEMNHLQRDTGHLRQG